MNTQKKVGPVLEGGAMRGMFTTGVVDTFMDENIHVDGIIGVSAGALFGPNYYSKQRGRALRYSKRFCKDRRNMSFWNFLFTGNLVSKQFAYYDITLKYDLFDNETFMKNNTGYYATATNVETGKAEYLEIKDIIKEMETLRATAAIPFVCQIVEVNGKKYLDGGVGDSIPVLQAKKMGYDKIIVVLTRPIEYRKKPLSSFMMKLCQIRYHKYPEFIKAMEQRYQDYNDTVEMIQNMEKNGEIFVVRPSEPIALKTIERNPDNLQKVYDLGVKDCKKVIHQLKEYIHQ
ncbi:MAG: patatin family protein [Erysipelotrichaceae bacterium]|nr:patatin family protein [Erysipelotrichaceae bacterium]